MKRALSLALIASLAATPLVATAWETATTHAGLTERAALASRLHERLTRDFGLEHGLYQVLEVPPVVAPELIELLARFSPTHGFSPDARGRQSALGWLVAGSAVADSPVAHFANHFFEPTQRRGLSGGGLGGLVDELRLRLAGAVSGGRLPGAGISALDWLDHRDNPMGLTGFLDQYDRAVTSPSPGERAHHLAGALTAAGALLHVLEDMGSPSHVHDDLAAHTAPLSELPGDRGSRFERLAALAYGRLGVPAPGPRPAPPRRLAELFTAADGGGLADRTAARFRSPSTLPGDRGVERGARRLSAAELGLPAGLGGADLSAAARPAGATLRNADGVCVARYRVREGRLTFAIDDRCALEQIAALLPEVSAHATALLDYLFRGSLALESSGGRIAVSAGPTALGPGTLILLVDDAAGMRREYHRAEVSGAIAGASLGEFAAPPAAGRVTALFKGKDDHGEPLRATGATGP